MLFLYQVRFRLLATNVNVSWIGADTGGASVKAMSVVQVAPAPQPSVGSVRCCSTRVTGVQIVPVDPVRWAVVMSGLAELSPLCVASASSPNWVQPPAASAAVGK